MKVKFILCLLVLVTRSRAGTVQISAYSSDAQKEDEQPAIVGSSKSGSYQETGRASGGQYPFPFDGLLSKPVKYRTSSYQDSYKSPKYIVYPSNSQSVEPSPNKNVAMDRFAPGEAFGGTVYKIQKARKEGYKYKKPAVQTLEDSSTASPPQPPPAPPTTTVQALPPPITPPPLPPLIVAPTPVPPMVINQPPPPPPPAPSSYIPPSPSDLTKFPPNIGASYPAAMNAPPNYNSPITSYLPPSNQYIPPPDLHNFPPNINSSYLPPAMDVQGKFNGISSYLPPPAGPVDDSTDASPPSSDSDDMIGTIQVGPDTQYLPPSQPMSMQMPSGMAPMSMQMQSNPPAPPPMMMNMAPMGMPPMADMGPPADHSFPDFSAFEHDHGHGYFYPHPHDHFPEYIYDHDHDHHHDEPPPMPPTTTTTAAPPMPMEAGSPRVKNYSYYYLSRTLWYVPLYFTLYFTIYVLVLILRSIARHKVQIPNQWVGSRSLESMPNLTNAQIMEKADVMTNFILKQIDEFREKYVG